MWVLYAFALFLDLLLDCVALGVEDRVPGFGRVDIGWVLGSGPSQGRVDDGVDAVAQRVRQNNIDKHRLLFLFRY